MKGGPSIASVSERTGGLGLAPGQDVEGWRRRRAPARSQKDARVREIIIRAYAGMIWVHKVLNS